MISMGSCLSQDVVSFYRTRFLVASHVNTVDAYDMARQVHFKFLQLSTLLDDAFVDFACVQNRDFSVF